MDKDNPSEYEMQFLNGDLIYLGEKNITLVTGPVWKK